jgi:cobaltochelatase CobN
LHAELTRESGAACTEFVCDNSQLQNFIASQLDASQKGSYERDMAAVKENTSGQREMILKQQNNNQQSSAEDSSVWQGTTIAIVIVVILAAIIFIRLRRGKEE